MKARLRLTAAEQGVYVMTTSRSTTRRGAVRMAAAVIALPLVHIGTTAAAGLAATMATMRRASAGDTTGVTATEIKIGHTIPYSGPDSSYSPSGRLEMAFFNKMVNDQGGIAGRKINFISYDDQYSPPKTV
jgi:ABC-type branched-subunit amino acid transport system substrate-binding protein